MVLLKATWQTGRAAWEYGKFIHPRGPHQLPKLAAQLPQSHQVVTNGDRDPRINLMNHFQLYYNNPVYADTLDLSLGQIHAYLQQNLLGWFIYLNKGNVINHNNMSSSEHCFVNIIQSVQPIKKSLKNTYLNYVFIVFAPWNKSIQMSEKYQRLNFRKQCCQLKNCYCHILR